jgi:aspartate aminotransferase-like enzyme
VKVCVDAMSAIGNIPLQLDGISIATCSSGKGLASIPGVAIVFTDTELLPNAKIPTYIDLGHYFHNNGIPFTISSNLIMALNKAVDYSLQDSRTKTIGQLSKLLLEKILKVPGVKLINKDYRFPTHITTIVPVGISSVVLGDMIKAAGVETSYNSGYLKERNQLQISIMGGHCEQDIESFIKELESALQKIRRKTAVNA